MSPNRLYHLIQLLICLTAFISMGQCGQGKRKNKKKQADAPTPTTPPTTPEPDMNMCDIEAPEVIYCYCDNNAEQSAEEGNCWIFNDSSDEKNAQIWRNFRSQSMMKRLTLHLRPDGTLTTIPTEAITHLPSLDTFEVQYAQINSVHPFAFGNSTSLTEISLTRNKIISLESHAFVNMPDLTKIVLGENQITDINRNVFNHLPKLVNLAMDNNNITSIQDRAFQSLHHLLTLDLYSNQIKAIVPDTFKGLRSLEKLDLHKNRIEVIGDLTFQDLEALQEVDLKENSLKYISPKSFYGLSKLQRLDLQDNKLLALGIEVFKYTPKLVYLDIRHNVLETLYEETFTPLMGNLRNENMAFYPEGNNFRCDNRLQWLFVLLNNTESRHFKKNLEGIFCYLESGTLPPRLISETPTPAYETSTLGIGPKVPLFSLKIYELPEPYVRGLFTTSQLSDSDVKTTQSTRHNLNSNSGRRRGGNRKNRQRDRNNPDAKTQSDMAIPKSSVTMEPSMEADQEVQRQPPVDSQPPPQFQESRTYNDGGAASNLSPSFAVLLSVISCLLITRIQ